MIIHIAIFKWKDGVGEKRVQNALKEVEALKEKVQGLQSIYAGKNFSPHAKHFTHAVVVIAEDQRALDEYRNHSDHQAVAQDIEEMEEDGIGVDFNSRDGK